MRLTVILVTTLGYMAGTMASPKPDPLEVEAHVAVNITSDAQESGGTGASEDIDRIIGGSEVVPHSHPWQVAMMRKDYHLYYSPKMWKTFFYEYHICGGVIICPNYVLTAGHCPGLREAYKITKSIQIWAGIHRIDEVPSEEELEKIVSIHDIKKSIRHPDYRNEKGKTLIDFDFRILELKQPIKIRKEARPVFLPNKDSDKNMYNGTETANLLVSGWGLTKRIKGFRPDPTHKSRRLKSVTVPSVSAKECKKAYKKELKQNMICAGMVGTGRLDTCQGDSGGPMVWLDSERVELIGLTSGGIGCGLSKYPGVYARITYVLDWVKKKTNDCNQKTCQKDNCMTKSKLISDVVERFQTISATDYTTTSTTPAYPCYDENPCKNGGTCSTGADGFAHCDCVPECSGKRCEDCEPCYLFNPCENGGTCSPGADGSAHCDCVPECSGETCEDCEPCFINPCKNGGTCYQDYIEGEVKESCGCPPRCSGKFCEHCDPCPEEVKCNRIGARIVGGCQVERNTFPWHVSVIKERRINEEQVADYAYGGTILCPTLILTAADAITNCGKKKTCAKNYCKKAPASNVKVWVGKHKSYPDPDGEEYKVSIVIPHPKWAFMRNNKGCRNRDDYDLAILKLARPIDLRTGSKAAAVYLPDNNNPTQGITDTPYVASGWGYLYYIKDFVDYYSYEDLPKPEEDLICKAEKLNAVQLSEIRGIHERVCAKKYKNKFNFSIMMCVGQKDYPETPTKGACWHDRGGPLVTLNKFTDEVQLIGVNSFGNYRREDCYSAPSVYADLTGQYEDKPGKYIGLLDNWEIDFGDGFTKNVSAELIKCNKRACAAEQCMKGKDLDPFVKSYFFD